MTALACDATSCGHFSTFVHAAAFGNDWRVSMYNDLCFNAHRKRWVLPTTAAQPDASRVRSTAFQRYPLSFSRVSEPVNSSYGGVTFIADLRHAGTGPPGIAHFAKRLLRLYGLEQQAQRYGLPPVSRVVFPATTRRQLSMAWPAALLRLVAPDASIVAADELMAAGRGSADAGRGLCFAHVAVSAREDTYFVRPEDADRLRARAHALASVPPRERCAPLRACYFRRSEGASDGKWEGGARVVANWRHVLSLMQSIVNTVAPGGTVDVVAANSSMSFFEQVKPPRCPPPAAQGGDRPYRPR